MIKPYDGMFESMKTAGKTGYVLDTCVLRRICDNENFAVSLSCRIGFEDSYVVVTSKALEEASRHGYDYATIEDLVFRRLKAPVRYEQITHLQHTEAKRLEKRYATLHTGDSDILVFARDKKTTLVTCDKGLAKAAGQAHCACINPDNLPCDTQRRPPTGYELTAKGAMGLPPKKNKILNSPITSE